MGEADNETEDKIIGVIHVSSKAWKHRPYDRIHTLNVSQICDIANGT